MKQILLSLLVAVALTACTNHGKKIEVEGTKGEVYYKGEGVTEDDAKKTGEFLKEQSFFSSGKAASIQIAKEEEGYTVRFVYDKEIYESMKGAEDAFKALAVKISKEVFGGKKVNIALADKSFKDFTTIPYDEAIAKEMETPDGSKENSGLTKADFDHEKAGGVDFYWKGISDDESKAIADYIVKNGAFADGTAEIYMTKESGRVILQFPVIESARTNPSVLAELDKVTKEIKDNVFPDAPYSFYMTDENRNTVKAWEY